MTWSLTSAPDLSEQEFSNWSKLLRERVGIRLNPNQRQFLQSQVSMRMREIGEESFGDYFARVCDANNGHIEWSILLDRLVVKETSFFRHQPSLNFVCGYLQDKIVHKQLQESFEIWSLGCATGEEAYSLAMLANEALELAKEDAYFGVLGTDISRIAISVARTGQFSDRKLSFLPPPLRYKYFAERKPGVFEFDHELADKMCFACSNVLHAEEMPKLDFDTIYCQNMLVYFDPQLRHEVLDTIAKRLKPGGILVIGLGEVTDWKNKTVERVARTDVQAYVKLDNKTVSM